MAGTPASAPLLSTSSNPCHQISSSVHYFSSSFHLLETMIIEIHLSSRFEFGLSWLPVSSPPLALPPLRSSWHLHKAPHTYPFRFHTHASLFVCLFKNHLCRDMLILPFVAVILAFLVHFDSVHGETVWHCLVYINEEVTLNVAFIDIRCSKDEIPRFFMSNEVAKEACKPKSVLCIVSKLTRPLWKGCWRPKWTLRQNIGLLSWVQTSDFILSNKNLS